MNERKSFLLIKSKKNRILIPVLLLVAFFVFAWTPIAMQITGTELFGPEIANAATKTASKVQAVDLSLPGTMLKGSSFVVSGRLKSSTKIVAVTVGVTNSAGKWMTNLKASDRPNAKSYYLNDLDSQLVFGKLPVGNYTYKVLARTKNCKAAVVVSHSFKVADMALESANAPGNIYRGDSFSQVGIVRADSRINYLIVGVKNAKGQWVENQYNKLSPNQNKSIKKYDLSKHASGLDFSQLATGEYTYYIYGKCAKSKELCLLEKKFTVSNFKAVNCKTPGELKEGQAFGLEGTVKSHYALTKIVVGVMNKSGDYKLRKAVKLSNVKKYDVAKLDEYIAFGSLKAGTYYYDIKLTDVQGVTRSLVHSEFKIVEIEKDSQEEQPLDKLLNPDGEVLAYDASLISDTIGAQSGSGLCALYSIAYCRAILDGSFSKGKYKTVKDKIISVYGHGTNYAQWRDVGGQSTYFTTAKSSFKAALKQITLGKPCILSVDDGYTGANHYVVIVGYVKGTTSSNVSLGRFVAIDPVYAREVKLTDLDYSNSSNPQVISFDY